MAVTYEQIISSHPVNPIDRFEIDENGVVHLFAGEEWRGFTSHEGLRWMLDNLSSTGQIGGSKGS